MFYNDIDEDIEDSEFSPIDKAVANQCIAIYDIITDVYIGSGILITNQGLFISASAEYSLINTGESHN